MTRYPYPALKQPPAPFVYLTLRHPVAGAEARGVPAQVDTAADRTLLPQAVADALGLDRIGELDIGGVGGTRDTMPLYAVLLGIQPLPVRLVEVVAHADEPWVLLGRDVLNGHRIVLDGPNLVLELG
jgi:hypothetical protein